MASSEKVAIIHRLFDEFYNKGELDVAEEIIAADAVVYDAGAPPARGGAELVKQRYQVQRTATPDFHMVLDEVAVEGDKVAYLWTVRGTQTGPMWDIPPTDRQFETVGATIGHFVGGRIVAFWHNYDMVGLLQQLGRMPPPGPARGYLFAD